MFSWFRFLSHRVRALVLGAVFSFSAAPALASGEDWVVLSATGLAPVAKGDVLESGAALSIPQGTVVTAVSEGGGVVRLVGPCDCALPQAKASRGDATGGATARTRGLLMGENLWIAALPALKGVTAPGASAETAAPIGADAAASPPDVAPGVWDMSVEGAGDRCLRRGAAMLWRPSVEAELSVALRTKSLAREGIVWAAGQRTMTLPDYFVEDGAPIVLDTGSRVTRLTLHVLPDTIDERNWGEVLIWMAARNCRVQAQSLVDGLNDGSLFPEEKRKPGLSEL